MNDAATIISGNTPTAPWQYHNVAAVTSALTEIHRIRERFWHTDPTIRTQQARRDE